MHYNIHTLSHTYILTYIKALSRNRALFPTIDFVTEAIELFKQVDVNGDGGMEWDEFSAFIVEAGE